MKTKSTIFFFFTCLLTTVSFNSFADTSSKSYFEMTPSEKRELIMKRMAEAKNTSVDEVSLASDNKGGYIEVVYEKYGQSNQKMISMEKVDISQEGNRMPSKTKTVYLSDNNSTISLGNDILYSNSYNGGIGVDIISQRYNTPFDGLANFGLNSLWVNQKGDIEIPVREEGETNGWFMFRQFRSYIENSAKSFIKQSNEEVNNQP